MSLGTSSTDAPTMRARVGQRLRQWVVNATLPGASIDPMTLWEVLANERRRDTIRVLDDLDAPIDVTDLAETMAALEHDIPVDQLDSDQRKCWYVALYQTHIPPLADAGLVDILDDRRGAHTVAPTDDLTAVREYMATVEAQTHNTGGDPDE